MFKDKVLQRKLRVGAASGKAPGLVKGVASSVLRQRSFNVAGLVLFSLLWCALRFVSSITPSGARSIAPANTIDDAVRENDSLASWLAANCLHYPRSSRHEPAAERSERLCQSEALLNASSKLSLCATVFCAEIGVMGNPQRCGTVLLVPFHDLFSDCLHQCTWDSGRHSHLHVSSLGHQDHLPWILAPG